MFPNQIAQKRDKMWFQKYILQKSLSAFQIKFGRGSLQLFLALEVMLFTHSLTYWLTDWLMVSIDLTDVTLVSDDT